MNLPLKPLTMITIVVCQLEVGKILRPGNVTGYQCAICAAKLQVSPAGVRNLKHGATAFCNRCGVEIASKMEFDEVVMSPNAVEQYVRMLKERHTKSA